MSYEPTVWQTGDTVTAEKLNKVENQLEKVSKICNITLACHDIGTSSYFLMLCKENTEESGPELVELTDRLSCEYPFSINCVKDHSINLGILNDMPIGYTGGKIYLAFTESVFNFIVKINGETVTIDDLESSSYKGEGSWNSLYLFCYEITDDTIVSISYD